MKFNNSMSTDNKQMKYWNGYCLHLQNIAKDYLYVVLSSINNMTIDDRLVSIPHSKNKISRYVQMLA